MSASLTCGNPSDAVPFLREWFPAEKGHVYSWQAIEIQTDVAAGNAISEGEAGYVFTTQETGTVPIYRMFASSVWDHYYTISPAVPNGFVLESTAGYVYPTQICGSIPLYVSYSSSARDHFYTTSSSENQIMLAVGGYVSLGIEAYVLPSNSTGQNNLFAIDSIFLMRRFRMHLKLVVIDSSVPVFLTCYSLPSSQLSLHACSLSSIHLYFPSPPAPSAYKPSHISLTSTISFLPKDSQTK